MTTDTAGAGKLPVPMPWEVDYDYEGYYFLDANHKLLDGDEVVEWANSIGASVKKALAHQRKTIEALKEALEASVTAIDDWLNIYAEDHCDEARVRSAKERVHRSGTLAYIAEVQQRNRAALVDVKKEGE